MENIAEDEKNDTNQIDKTYTQRQMIVDAQSDAVIMSLVICS